MTSREVLEHEIRSVAGEMIAALAFVAQGISPISRAHGRNLVLEIEHQLAHMARLIDQLS
jgi:hypothetical protein